MKELAEQQGLKATIEAPVPGGGQVDVLIERDGVLAAIEVSVSTPVEYERQNLEKCLRAGYPKVAVVLAKSKTQQSAYRAALYESVPDTDRERVSYLTPEEIPDYIAALAPPPPRSERIVRGYRVKGAVSPVTAGDAKARRDAVARLIAKSLSGRLNRRGIPLIGLQYPQRGHPSHTTQCRRRKRVRRDRPIRTASGLPHSGQTSFPFAGSGGIAAPFGFVLHREELLNLGPREARLPVSPLPMGDCSFIDPGRSFPVALMERPRRSR